MRPPLSSRGVRLFAGLSGVVAVAVLAMGMLAGCGPPPAPPPAPAPPSLVGDPAAPSPVPSLPVPSLPAIRTPPSPGFPEDRAVRCGSSPGGDQLVALLRTEQVLPQEVEATVVDGPLCAGTWQYAVISVPDAEPLQVVTRGEPAELELVTAGTDVCTVDVRVRAPAGIRLAADC